ncbi:MAG TPA: adenylate/guanylate cyclase domain-containing protein [Thermoplasmata archaeon]|nr:adenylate/guanylate cyclase domain-containing protein [Thermoplasmata archaeon]
MASTRRLSAIMFTDMVGSTASAQANEAQALKLRDEQAALLRPLFAVHQGREVKSMGDGFLTEFDSALRAVQCSIDIQQHLHERNSQPGVAPIRLRIGIHLGDVEQRESDIFGDAVNIASRIESIAEPSGICVSGAVHEQVRNKIADRFEKLPPTLLKGLERSMDLYRVLLPWTRGEAPVRGTGPPRLAVLPFSNISPDLKDEYFADGLTEELITVLSQLREIRVIARTSVAQYKSTNKSAAQIGAELGVDAILEGSVRKSGDDLRITVQLIDGATQEHTWANTYDRKLEKVFAVQAEIAKQVAEGLRIKLRPTETARLESQSPVMPDSYLAYLRGRSLLVSQWSDKGFRAAKQHFEVALSIDETNARAHSGLADALKHIAWAENEPLTNDQESVVRDHVARALQLDPNLAEAHCSLGLILWDENDHRGAAKEMELALSINPSLSYAHFEYALILLCFARSEDGLRELALAEELDPISVQYADWHAFLLIMLRRLDEAAVRLDRLKELDKAGIVYSGTLSYYLWARGDFDGALQACDRLAELRGEPAWTGRVMSLSSMGKKEEAWKLIREAEALPKKPLLEERAMWRAFVGDVDGCFQYLDESFESHQLTTQVWMFEPALGPIRSDPRFAQLLKKLNLA